MTTATVSSKSQITLPAAACREAGIKPHDRVLVEVREGVIVIRSAPDLMDFKGFALNAQASKTISVLILYGGVAYESSRMGLTYTSTDPTVPPAVDITMDGANNMRFTLGAGLSLGILNIFADANFGSVTSFSGGIGFGR